MHLRAILTLSFSVLTAGELQRKIKPKEGKKCVHEKAHNVLIKLGPENQRVGRCKEKCLLDEKCVAMQFVPPKRCSLWYTAIEAVRNILSLICYLLFYLSELDKLTLNIHRWNQLMKVHTVVLSRWLIQ